MSISTTTTTNETITTGETTTSTEVTPTSELVSPLEHTTLDSGELATLIAEFGIGRFEPEVADAAASAIKNGAPAHLAHLVTDRSTPEIVRERAFGRIAEHMPNPK
jgi:hypothetical protein